MQLECKVLLTGFQSYHLLHSIHMNSWMKSYLRTWDTIIQEPVIQHFLGTLMKSLPPKSDKM